jgi:hypothetical protein
VDNVDSEKAFTEEFPESLFREPVFIESEPLLNCLKPFGQAPSEAGPDFDWVLLCTSTVQLIVDLALDLGKIKPQTEHGIPDTRIEFFGNLGSISQDVLVSNG